jgi:hypothetical protein
MCHQKRKIIFCSLKNLEVLQGSKKFRFPFSHQFFTLPNPDALPLKALIQVRIRIKLCF